MVNTNGGTEYLVSSTLEEAIETTPNIYQRQTATGTGIPLEELLDDDALALALSLLAETDDAAEFDDDGAAAYDGSWAMPPTT
jgi:hypothetical protein